MSVLGNSKFATPLPVSNPDSGGAECAANNVMDELWPQRDNAATFNFAGLKLPVAEVQCIAPLL